MTQQSKSALDSARSLHLVLYGTRKHSAAEAAAGQQAGRQAAGQQLYACPAVRVCRRLPHLDGFAGFSKIRR